MAAGVDVRVDPHGDAHAGVVGRCARDEARHFAGGLDVDRAEIERDRQVELGAGLADSGEHDVRRCEAGAPGHLDFPAGIGVGRRAQLAHQPDDARGRVGFDRVVQPVGMRAEGRVQRLIAIDDRRPAVDVDGRLGGAGDVVEGHAVTGQSPLDAGEGHGGPNIVRPRVSFCANTRQNETRGLCYHAPTRRSRRCPAIPMLPRRLSPTN